ncbi:HAD family hydrolase [Streptomyces abikoensis]|uniref:HAD family hydrolase n=1 Tax=Streptomyces abikoensis TaxID=97398 RepID=UPI001677E813|nr:HAD family hydrolase [Streptomyces abikoensis]GGP40307.1 hypothetical protein GCM10010214_12120 [Streptomyces abikoensis]
MQRLVLFDLDDTLIDRSGALVSWVTEFTARHRLGDHVRRQLIARLKDRASPAAFGEIRTEYCLAPSRDSLWREYRRDIAASVACSDAVLAGLAGLRASGWRVGIATNGPSDIQTAKLRAAGILEHVDGVCVSEAACARKPEVAFFVKAAEACDSSLSGGGWMVGDNPETDICGGQAAGLRTVWVSRDRHWPTHLAPPDRSVPNALAAIELLLNVDHSRGAA